MKTVLVFIIGIGAGVVIIRYWFKKRKCRVSEQERIKQERKEKILLALRNSKGNKLANNDVEKLFGVSDATAERYLNELEKEGKIRQVGKTGVSVYYEKI